MDANAIPAGRYRHYKGKEYTVLGAARHSETEGELVVYRQEYGERALWVRPKQMFLETVQVDGRQVPRFQFLGDELADDSSVGNLLADIPATVPKELFLAILTLPSLRIERIVSHGHASPEQRWYEQAQAVWIAVLRGQARLVLAGDEQPVELGPGDFLNIPAHKRHRIEWTTPHEPTVWLAIHYTS